MSICLSQPATWFQLAAWGRHILYCPPPRLRLLRLLLGSHIMYFSKPVDEPRLHVRVRREESRISHSGFEASQTQSGQSGDVGVDERPSAQNANDRERS